MALWEGIENIIDEIGAFDGGSPMSPVNFKK